YAFSQLVSSARFFRFAFGVTQKQRAIGVHHDKPVACRGAAFGGERLEYGLTAIEILAGQFRFAEIRMSRNPLNLCQPDETLRCLELKLPIVRPALRQFHQISLRAIRQSNPRRSVADNVVQFIVQLEKLETGKIAQLVETPLG